MRKNRQIYKNWFLQACYDLNDAIFLKDNGKYNIACFLAQQAAEKAFKSFLFFGGIPAKAFGPQDAEIAIKIAKK